MMRGGPRPPLLVAALLAAAAAGTESSSIQQVFQLDGACSYLNFLNGLRFARQPQPTASGAPYYKAVSHSYYMYYDPNCVGHSDGTPRWIIDSDEPSLTRAQDLDGDGDCNFHAHVSSGDLTRPPAKAMWTMRCDNQLVDTELTLTDIPQLDRPTITVTTTTGPPTTTTTTTEVPRMYRLEGACDFLGFLNTVTFWLQGNTATGAPFWKAADHDYYIYFDPDCHGGTNAPGTARWIIDNSAPDVHRLKDLDNDGDCSYHAHTDSTDFVKPPSQATWTMFCNHRWVPHQISIFEVTTTTTTTTTTTSSTTSTSTITSSTTTTVSTTTSTTVTTTVSSTTTSTSSGTGTSTTTTTATETSTSVTSTSTSSITSTSSRTSTTATTTAPPPTTTAALSQQGTTPSVDDADGQASCSTFVCPQDMVPRPNASEVMCAGDPCGDVDNTTCCEEASFATTLPPAAAVTTTEAASDASATFLRMTGTCSEKAVLEGVIFAQQGTTASGAPYYKGVVASGKAYYVYHDPSCGGSAEGKPGKPPRWVLDSDEPSMSRTEDLDGDGKCEYFARVDTADHGRPPVSAKWRMHCGGAWKDVSLQFEAVPAMSTTPVPPAPAPGPAPRHSSLPGYLLSGVCDYQKYLNGLIFMKEGVTASGAPFYKVVGKEYYIYWDAHCDGHDSSVARWVIDTQRPNSTSVSDLDGDGECHYLARLVSPDSSSPPLDTSWRVYCGHGWEEVRLQMKEAFTPVPMNTSGSSFANETCEGKTEDKVSLASTEKCSLAASYLNLSNTTVEAVQLPGHAGFTGCVWLPGRSALYWVTSSGHDHDAGHQEMRWGFFKKALGGVDAGNSSEHAGDHGSGHGGDVHSSHGGEHGGAATGDGGHGGEAAGHGGNHSGDASGHHSSHGGEHGGAATGDDSHSGEAAGHGGSHSGDAHSSHGSEHGGAAGGEGSEHAGAGGGHGGSHGGDASGHGGAAAGHGGEASGHAAQGHHGEASGHHRRLEEEEAGAFVLCSGGLLAPGGHDDHQRAAVISGATGLCAQPWVLGVVALAALGFAAGA